MRRKVIALAALGALVTAGAMAQDGGKGQDRGGPFAGGGAGFGGRHGAMTPEDRAAFTDARIAALHAGLKLTPDQEKMWPPVEAAIRDFVKQRQDARRAMRERFVSLREGGGPPDLPAQLRFYAERQSTSANAMLKLADASAPLYASLDEGQKRRMARLSRFMRFGMAGRHGPGWGGGPRGMRHGERDGRGRSFAHGEPAGR